jgi:NTP pyrophosphatase (non-canonical NTP hydrolase)
MTTLNEFHKLNFERMHKDFLPPVYSITSLVVCVQEEVGELAGAVLGVTGEKKRKAHLTNDDVLDAVADAITYLSLVASTAGCSDLESLLFGTFNMVSERANSNFKLNYQVDDNQTPMLTAIDEACKKLGH